MRTTWNKSKFKTLIRSLFPKVCYILSGSLKVEDSLGHTNILSDGDVQVMRKNFLSDYYVVSSSYQRNLSQWLTAGRGVVHSEIPHPRVHGILLWVNLSAKNKMIPPRNQELIKSEVPVVEKNGVRIALIAGKSMNVEVLIS